MLEKPEGCRACPMYQTGQGFVPDEVVPGSVVSVIGQNPGADEVAEGRPFVGKTGLVMMKTYFPLAGLIRGENVSIHNTIRCRWRGTNDLPPKAVLTPAVEACRKYLRIPETTRLIVAQGALAWQATGGPAPITDWQGFLAPGGYV